MLDTEILTYKAFMAAIEHKHLEEVKDILFQYDIGKYIIAKEITKTAHSETNGEHFHFIVEMTDKDYHRFSKRLFIDRFNLRGRASKGKPRQYGKVKQIENIEKMKAYTLKENQYESNLSEEELKLLFEQSYQKKEEIDEQEELFKYLGEIKLLDIDKENGITIKDVYNSYTPEWEHNQYINYCRLCKGVIKFYIERNKSRRGLTKAAVEGIVRKYIMYIYEDMGNDDKAEWIYNSLFSKYL
jgi:hypothetical protein